MAVMTAYEHGQFCWVDLVAHDAGAARSFYESLFGWTYKELDTQGGPPYGQFEIEGQSVCGIGQMSEEMKAQGIPPMWNNYVNVDEIETVLTKAKEHGATVTMEKFQVLDAGWLAFLQDPTGGHLGLWQRNQHWGAERVNSLGCFCWNELATREIEKAKDFYSAVFGWEASPIEAGPLKYYVVKNKGRENGGLLEMTKEWGEIPPHWGVYFTVANVHDSVAKVKELQGRVNVEPFKMTVGEMAQVCDPQGAGMYLLQLDEQPK